MTLDGDIAVFEEKVVEADKRVSNEEDSILSLMEKTSHIAKQLDRFDRDYFITLLSLLLTAVYNHPSHIVQRSTVCYDRMISMNALIPAQLRRSRSADRRNNIQHSDDHDSDSDLLEDDTADMSESMTNFGRTTMFFNQRQQLRVSLRNFFMNPFEKYAVRGKFPFKLTFHVLKLICLTSLLVFFGQDKFQLRRIISSYKNSLGYILVRDYSVSSTGDIEYPEIHTHRELHETLSYSLVNFFNLTENALGVFGFNIDNGTDIVLPKLCVESFSGANVDMETWSYTFIENVTTTCFDMDCTNLTRRVCEDRVAASLPDSYDGFMGLTLTFSIRSIFLSLKSRPKCVVLEPVLSLLNEVLSGTVSSSFELGYDEVKCNTNSTYHPSSSLAAVRAALGQVILDGSVICLSLITCLLVLKRLKRTWNLFQEVRTFYSFHYNRRLTWAEIGVFCNGWDFFSVFADILIFCGVIFKLLLDSGVDKHLDITAVLVGSAVAINWVLALRFLSFDKGYYILVLTISVAAPNVLRLLICILAIYLGYVFCGWVVFGPYMVKFNSLVQASDTLFAMLNGDELLDTFMMVERGNTLLFVFSKIYFYSFIILFIYVILSVMISLIGDAMVAAQSAVKTGMGHWLVEGRVFPELELGSTNTSQPPSPLIRSGQNLNNTQNRL
eukprot:sb/3462754/